MKELTCLNEELIQQWIDGELSEELRMQVVLHLAGCEECRQKAEQQHALALSIKKILQVEDVAIPEFLINGTSAEEHGNFNKLSLKNSIYEPEGLVCADESATRSNKKFPLWLKIAAVLIPAFCLVQVLIRPDKTYQPSHDELLMYQSLSDLDANAAFQERVMVTTSTNREGEIVEFEIR